MMARTDGALRVVLVTAPDSAHAQRIARTLVEERLVACVNLVSGVTSVYRWQGRIEESLEVMLIMKTVDARVAQVVKRVQALHPYEVPEVIALPVHATLEAYGAWVVAETGPNDF